MTKRRFFYLFLLSLAARGVTHIVTKDDLHHRNLTPVAEWMKILEDDTALNISLIPNPFSGRYQNWDQALLDAQRGLVSIAAPYFEIAKFEITPEQATEMLSDEPAKETFNKLAQIWIDNAESNV